MYAKVVLDLCSNGYSLMHLLRFVPFIHSPFLVGVSLFVSVFVLW